MADPFADYAKKANTIVNSPARLVGVMKTRAEARLKYAAIVEEMNECSDADMLEGCLAGYSAEVIQFQTELDFLWEGEDDFLGLREEIARARARCDEPGTSRYFEKETEA